jgi:hypothetical protein
MTTNKTKIYLNVYITSNTTTTNMQMITADRVNFWVYILMKILTLISISSNYAISSADYYYVLIA